MPEDLTVEQKAETLARMAAARAAELALTGAEKAQDIAVKRAVKDAIVERDLADHSRHLDAINGSQRKMAESLGALQVTMTGLADTFDRQAAVTNAIGKHLKDQASSRFSKWTMRIAALGGLAAYGSILAILLSGH